MKKILTILISMVMLFNYSNVYAIDDDKSNEIVGTTDFIDENGNISKVEVYDGTTGEEDNPYLRRVTTANMVNFNCSKAGTTTSYIDCKTGQSGYISKANGADAAFLGYENGKVKFMMSGVTGLVDPNLVEVVNQGTYYASNYEVNSKGLLYHYVSINVNALGNSNGQKANYNYLGEAPSYLSKGIEYYSYDGHYFYTNYDTMISDYKANVRTHSVNSNNPYYFYYQYLPLRSKTNYSGQELSTYLNKKANSSSSKLNNTGDIFIKYQNKFGVNAMLTACFAAHESGWGNSSIAINKNNLFGLNATDNNPGGNADTFNSVDDCIYNFTSSWMSKRYLNATYTSRFRGGYFGDKASGIFGQYSSDPYEGEKLAAMAANLDAEIANKDKNYYSIGIKDIAFTTNTSVNVRKENNTNSTILYTTLSNAGYAFIVRNKTADNGFYQIQSDSSLTNDRSSISSNAEYNYDTSYAYISNKYVTLLNNGNDISKNDKNTSNVEGQSTGKADNEPTLYYQSMCQNIGWLDQVNEPNTTGTTGRSLNLYQLKFELKNANPTAYLSGKIYNSNGWNTYDVINNDTIVGNDSLPIQMINFSANYLTGYKLQYRVHSSDIGWQSWIDEGNNAGVSGKNIQAIDFRIVKDSTVTRLPGIYYSQHLSNIGWTNNLTNGNGYGNTSNNLEALKIGIDNLNNYNLTVKTIDSNNNEDTYTNVSNSTIIGSTGKSLGLKMINMSLSNSNYYELKYRAYIDGAWTSWVSQGNNCGSKNTGVIKDIQIKLEYVLHITSITLNKTDITLTKGTSETLQATINPSDTTDDKKLVWTSSNPDVATVDEDGNVTGLSLGEATITVETSNGKKAKCKVTVVKQTPKVEYQTHIENIGWQGWKTDGEMSGTSGQSKRLEAIQIQLKNNSSYKGALQYQTHIENIGWQGWKQDGEMSGTSGQSKRLEAIKIKLTDELAKNYDIYYRVHAQNLGWLDWASNGESAGTAGYSYRLEGIEIKLVEKGGSAPGKTERPYVQRYVSYQTHIENIGWQEMKYDGETSGTSGQSRRLEGINISLNNPQYEGNIEYQTHIENIGWQGWKANGQMSGTSGQSKRLEAIKIKLTGEMANKYDIYYRVHAQEFGWLGWASNGESAGTEGYSYRLEAIEIKLVKKGGSAPGSTDHCFYKR